MLKRSDLRNTKKQTYLVDRVSLDVTQNTQDMMSCFNIGYVATTEARIFSSTTCQGEFLSEVFDYQSRHIMDTLYGDIRRDLDHIVFMHQCADSKTTEDALQALLRKINDAFIK
jgi:hypothetical protein